MAPPPPLVAALCVVLLGLTAGAVRSALAACSSHELVAYKLDVETHWSKRRFPKHYPLWRPPAQFSKFFGMSHNSSRVLFRPGELASEAVRQFAEHGSSAGLEVIAQGHSGVLDQFTAPPVKQGEGSAHARIFVDGIHSQVSLMSKIVPSPDWFVGIDSVDLCDGGRWIDSLDVKLFPMDGGTDQGMTFTSPNWASEPHEPICQITSRKPSHPAGSFHYPTTPTLPPIASLRFARMSLYKLSDSFERRPDTVTYTVGTLDPSHAFISASSRGSGDQPGLRVLVTSDSAVNRSSTARAVASAWRRSSNVTSAQLALQLPKDSAKTAPPSQLRPNGISQWQRTQQVGPAPRPQSAWPAKLSSTGAAAAPPPPAQNRDASAAREVLRPNGEVARAALGPDGSVTRVALRPDGSVARVALRPDGPPVKLGGLRVWAVQSGGVEGAKVAAGDKKAIIRKIAKHYHRRKGRHRQRRLRRRRRKRGPRNCQVGEWSAWGACSRACGIGETTRRRTVTHHALRGGRPCPSLQERRWCGSERSCTRRRYFRW
ncbi:spondin-1-like [Pollicipes pollicipes]|uniref:spondin-1-like n=1 Tax=Pollicipes pollicipes TaxID=41117 RepID=UPI00188560AB|nr:spondin-1-like [Pollicipes pollicipes]